MNRENCLLEMCLESFKFQRNVRFLHCQRDINNENLEFSELGLNLVFLSEMCFCAANSLRLTKPEWEHKREHDILHVT